MDIFVKYYIILKIYKPTQKLEIIIAVIIGFLITLSMTDNLKVLVGLFLIFCITIYWQARKRIVSQISFENQFMKIQTSILFNFSRKEEKYAFEEITFQYKSELVGKGSPTKVLYINCPDIVYRINPILNGWSYQNLDEIIKNVENKSEEKW